MKLDPSPADWGESPFDVPEDEEPPPTFRRADMRLADTLSGLTVTIHEDADIDF
jgi:hypothetical protein